MFGSDPDVKREVEVYDKLVKEKYGEVIGNTNVFLEGGLYCEIKECNLGNLFTEAAVEYFMRKRPRTGNGWTDAAVCVNNGGGIRSSINATNNGGNITLEDLMSVFPFSNNMLTLELTGLLYQVLF